MHALVVAMSDSDNRVPEPTGSTPEAQLIASAARARAAWQHLWLRLRSVTPAMLVRFVMVILAAWGIFWLLTKSLLILAPFILGALLAYLLLPLVDRLHGLLPRWLAVTLVFAGGLILAITAVRLGIPPLAEQIGRLLQSTPTFEELESLLTEANKLVSSLPPNIQTWINNGLNQTVTTLQTNLVDYLQGILRFLMGYALGLVNTVTFVLGFLITPFWLFYVLNDYHAGKRVLKRLLPTWAQADVLAILRICDNIFSSYLRGQVLLGLSVGLASYIGLSALSALGFGGIQYILVLAIIAGITELIPYAGPVLGAIPAVALALTHSWESALAVLVLYIVIQQLENYILVPRVLGHSVDIHPALMMLILLVLSQFGLLWVILAAPLAAMLRDLFRYTYGRLSDPPLPAGILPWETPTPVAPAPDPSEQTHANRNQNATQPPQ